MDEPALITVTEQEFFEALKADKRDIMPSIIGGWGPQGYVSLWQTNNGARTLFGRSTDKGEHRWQLVRAIHEAGRKVGALTSS